MLSNRESTRDAQIARVPTRLDLQKRPQMVAMKTNRSSNIGPRPARPAPTWLALGGLLIVLGALWFVARQPAPRSSLADTPPAIATAAAQSGEASPAPARLPETPPPHSDPEFHTFSICAIDPAAGQCGVAVTTRVPQVGRYVPWVRAGVGAVATQATTAVNYGREGLALLAAGKTPTDTISELLANDDNRESRQLGIIDMQGRAAAFTGSANGTFAGDRQGKNYTVQGNLLVGREVIDAVAANFESTENAGVALADRLIAALEAGQATGGDRRTWRMQSAALVVADAEHTGVGGDHIVETLQVAEHPEPVGELRRQYNAIHQRLGYREFAIVAGPDVVELKRMLHQLKMLWPERAEFPSRADQADLAEFTRETAEAVERFRQEQQLTVAEDRAGHPVGLVDRALVERLKSAYQAALKEQAATTAGEKRGTGCHAFPR